MFQDKIRISAVSYLNTLPFLYGIRNSDLFDKFTFELNYPAICAQKLIDQEVDLSLIPVAAIPLVKQASFISDYCIGAFKNVRTVLLLSDVPLPEIKSVLLDYQSRTSVNLVQVLAKKYWAISPEWINAADGFENHIAGEVAGLVIGDRTFALSPKYNYVYDLSSEWYKFTRLPFVFATWVANRSIEPELISQFNAALKFGLNHIWEVDQEYKLNHPESVIDLYGYLTKNISFDFDDEKKKSLKLFYRYLAELKLIADTAICDLI